MLNRLSEEAQLVVNPYQICYSINMGVFLTPPLIPRSNRNRIKQKQRQMGTETMIKRPSTGVEEQTNKAGFDTMLQAQKEHKPMSNVKVNHYSKLNKNI